MHIWQHIWTLFMVWNKCNIHGLLAPVQSWYCGWITTSSLQDYSDGSLWTCAQRFPSTSASVFCIPRAQYIQVIRFVQSQNTYIYIFGETQFWSLDGRLEVRWAPFILQPPVSLMLKVCIFLQLQKRSHYYGVIPDEVMFLPVAFQMDSEQRHGGSLIGAAVSRVAYGRLMRGREVSITSLTPLPLLHAYLIPASHWCYLSTRGPGKSLDNTYCVNSILLQFLEGLSTICHEVRVRCGTGLNEADQILELHRREFPLSELHRKCAFQPGNLTRALVSVDAALPCFGIREGSGRQKGRRNKTTGDWFWPLCFQLKTEYTDQTFWILITGLFQWWRTGNRAWVPCVHLFSNLQLCFLLDCFRVQEAGSLTLKKTKQKQFSSAPEDRSVFSTTDAHLAVPRVSGAFVPDNKVFSVHGTHLSLKTFSHLCVFVNSLGNERICLDAVLTLESALFLDLLLHKSWTQTRCYCATTGLTPVILWGGWKSWR